VGPKSLSGRFGEEKNLAVVGIRTPTVRPVASRYTDSRLTFSAGFLSIS
jgi:hypothetical protein